MIRYSTFANCPDKPEPMEVEHATEGLRDLRASLESMRYYSSNGMQLEHLNKLNPSYQKTKLAMYHAHHKRQGFHILGTP
jgi:hypothetical protein